MRSPGMWRQARSGSIRGRFALSLAMSDPQPIPPPPPAPRRLPGALWILLAIAVLLAALLAWKGWRDRNAVAVDSGPDLSAEALDQRLLQVEAGLAALRRAQDTTNQRLVDTRARTGLLRDELLGVTQRSALLEDSVQELSGQTRDGIAALRLDEVELLLALAQQRLALAGDLPGAIRATELADGVLSMQRDPRLLDLRQTVAQELAALRALPPNPAARAESELDALEAALPRLASASGRATAASGPAPSRGWRHVLDAFVQIRADGDQDLFSPADRSAGEAALALEFALARTALGRADERAFRASLARIDGWLARMYPDSALLAERRKRLAALRTLPLGLESPVAGSSLEQLRRILRARPAS
jgi:uroporphyrin-3 C-methyltransferase